MLRIVSVLAASLLLSTGAWCQKPPLLPEKDVAAIAEEISGETAKRNLEGIAQYHRQRGSRGFHAAAELVAGKLREYGLSDVAILQFPADGATMYGTQRSRPAWDATLAELWIQRTEIEGEGGEDPVTHRAWAADRIVNRDFQRIANYGVTPIVLAEDSESADATAELVDVGEGTKEKDYANRNVKGKIVLVSAQPGAVQDLAVGKFGAVGIVSYAQNQKTAWWGENQDAVRWGHLETFSSNKTFAFMVSLRTARALQERLAKGEPIQLHAAVKAGQHPGNYEVVTASIPGADPKLKDEEIAYSCHLDHQRPGANDNASGCATILEVARTLQHLIATGKLARPARTMRFIFPPEIEGTMALLNSDYDNVHPLVLQKSYPLESRNGEIFVEHFDTRDGTAFYPYYKHIKAVVHMDMVGGGAETKAGFHVTRGPMSLPSFVQDVAWAFAEWVNEETYRYAATGKAAYPLVEAEGGKEPLRAEYSAYTMGSDHDVYQDSSFGIPAIYLNDWPDRFIHTNLDAPANIDATKLKRVGLIGAASGYFLAGMGEDSKASVEKQLTIGRFLRDAQTRSRIRGLDETTNCVCLRGLVQFEAGLLSSFHSYLSGQSNIKVNLSQFWENCPRDLRFGEPVIYPPIYRRVEKLKGPMAVFGYDYFAAEWAMRGHTTKPKLLEYEGLWGGGEEYAYEVLNFADGKRNVQEIRDAVSAEYGPVPLELVVEYLKALEEIGVVQKIEAKKQ